MQRRKRNVWQAAIHKLLCIRYKTDLSQMKSYTLLLITLYAFTALKAQQHPSSIIFAHNDYHQDIPLLEAYKHRVGYIEADVFLKDNQLFVAHTSDEIQNNRTLDNLYFKPLRGLIIENKGLAYPDSQQNLVLMIDLKTAGLPTINAIIAALEKYPELRLCPTLKIAVSGNMPEPNIWKTIPALIHFDGRPDISYSPNQLKRLVMISTSFSDYSNWNGKGVLTAEDYQKLSKVIRNAHALGQKIRFWGAPDFTNAWIELRNHGVDIINSDNIQGLASFMNGLEKNFYINHEIHAVYQPKYEFKKEAKNVILLIGDGTGLAQWYAGYTANGGNLNTFQIKHTGYSITNSIDSYITDSAAGATAMSSGTKTKNRFIGVDSAGNALPLITELLKKKGFKTAVITSGDITDATPAAFYAHVKERNMSSKIAEDCLESNIDILIGSGYEHFSDRADGKNLVLGFQENGYFVSTSIDDMQGQKEKMVILDKKASTSIQEGRGQYLSNALKETIAVFDQSSSPFFIMEEAAQIDWGGHNNDLGFIIREVLDFDQTIGEAMKYVDENQETLLIITADHGTGGLSLIGGDFSEGSVRSNFSTNDHTGIMVPVFAYGPESDLFQGVYQNTAIFEKIMFILNRG